MQRPAATADVERDDAHHRIALRLDHLLAERGLTLIELSARVGVTVANLSILKNGRARAIRFSTLTALCDALDCSPGDLLTIDTRDQTPATSPDSDRLRPTPDP
jgi:putative transcriptional regulator